LALALCLTLACGGSDAPIVVGAAAPWNEPYAVEVQHGIELALSEINDSGGIRGRKVTLLMRDDEAKGTKAAQVAAEFLANQDVVAVVGHVNSAAMVAAARVYDGGLPAIAVTTTTPDLTNISPWVFRVIPSDSVNGVDLARFAERMSFTRAAVLYENDAYGRGLASAFRRAYRGHIVAVDPIPGTAGADYEPYIAWIKAQQPAIDAVLMITVEGPGVALMREARRQRLAVAFVGSDGWTGLSKYPEVAEGVYVAQAFTATDPRAEVQRFVAAYRTRYGTIPTANAALGYDAMHVAVRAIGAAGSDRRRVRDWLAAAGQRVPLPGVTGPIAFNENGDVANKPFAMTRLAGRDFVIVSAAGGAS
ncbi:MAG: ABC transporter substrate-binding protein, partial [Gemmatimonadaceae bacterium]